MKDLMMMSVAAAWRLRNGDLWEFTSSLPSSNNWVVVFIIINLYSVRKKVTNHSDIVIQLPF
jgi:hypothetical protein